MSLPFQLLIIEVVEKLALYILVVELETLRPILQKMDASLFKKVSCFVEIFEHFLRYGMFMQRAGVTTPRETV